MFSRDCVEDEVKTSSMLSHLIFISRNDHVIRAQAKRVFFLVRGSGKDYYMGSKRMGKLYRHMTQSTETYHTDLLASGDAPMPHGRVCCNSGAQERRGSGEIQIGRNA